MTEPRVQRRLAAILAADVVGYSRLMGQDEAETLSRVKALWREIVEPRVTRHGGRIVKLMGDGALVEFASAVDAVACAAEIQAKLAEGGADEPEAKRIRLRIGINVGDVIVDGDDIYGDGVNIAARLEAMAEPGGVFVSRSVADQVRDKLPLRFASLGEHKVKNIERPIKVFRIADANEPATAVSATAVPAPRPAEKPSIAVLAFTNMSGDAEQEYFSDGISEDVITDLSKLSELHVIARNSSFVYKRSPVSIPEIAKALGVRYVLEGSVRRAGARVRVTAQLIDASTAGHVWAERWDRDLTDIFAVQDELTREIVAALKLKLTADEKRHQADRRTIDVEAYNLFLRAREHAWLETRAGNIAARELLAHAITIVPDYAAAHAYVGFTHLIDYINGWGGAPEQSLETGLQLAERALAMDGDEAMAHFVIGGVQLWRRDFVGARQSLERCLEVVPNWIRARMQLARLQIFDGDPTAAIAGFEHVMRLDPQHPDLAHQFLAEARLLLGEYESAVEQLARRLARNPDAISAHVLTAVACGHLGRITEGKQAWQEVLRLDPGYSIERQRRVMPYRDPAAFEIRVDGLRKLGVTLT
jgi:TolB-like protein/class 3 adenylate cyclase/Flp pilus assembly protein TadD